MKYTLCIILLLFAGKALCQSIGIGGAVMDENNTPLSLINVKLTNNKSVSKNTLSNKDGIFTFKNLPATKYIITFNTNVYDPYADTINLANAIHDTLIDLGQIHMTHKIHMLGEVNVVDKPTGMMQKDDTLEFFSGAYKVNPDADAYDMVRKMPTIDMNGHTITAQGENIMKILVDGKPFFGNDAYAVLKALPAEIIDKVQVYNAKSEQEQFTGFSESATQKNINIITKTDKRKGLFGNVYSGSGKDNSNENRYGIGGTLNKFDGDHRFTLTLQSNNVNEQNFTEANAPNGGVGGLSYVNAGGFNYTDQWGKKMDISCSYFYNQSNTAMINTLHRTYIVSVDSGQVYDQNNLSSAKNYSHRFTAGLTYTIDSMNTLRLSPSFNFNKSLSNSQQLGNTTGGTEPINLTSNNTIGNQATYNFSNNLIYQHKFHKTSRTFSATLNAGNNYNTGAIVQMAQNTYFNNPYSDDTTNRQTSRYGNAWNITANVAYTEPTGKNSMLKVESNFFYLPAQSINTTNNYSALTRSYSLPDSIYSNSFTSYNKGQKTGLSYLFKIKNCELSFGAFYKTTQLQNQEHLPVRNNLNSRFENMLPVCSIKYKISPTKNLQLIYNTNDMPPTIYQLQNVVNTSDPLHLSTGNPGLKEPIMNNASLQYSNYNTVSKINFSLSANGSYTQNNIGTQTIIAVDDTILPLQHITLIKGTQLTMPVNIEGASAINANMNIGIPLNFIKCNFKFGINTGVNSNPAIINNSINIQHNKNSSFMLSLNSNISTDIDFIISSNTSLISNDNSLNKQANTTAINENANAVLNLVFLKSGTISTNISYMLNSGLSTGYNTGNIVWNISIGKKFFRNQRTSIKLAVFDLLNENKNIQHSITDTYVQDSKSNTLQRYLLIIINYSIRNFKSK